MPRKIGEITDRLARADSIAQRRGAAGELRDAGLAKRFSLEKRGSLGEPAAAELADHEHEILTDALADDDREVRRAAIVAAGDLGDTRCVPALIGELDKGDDEIQLAAIDALGEIGGAESLAALARLASEPKENADVRLAALTELEELTAKAITSGPDRRFDPPEDPSVASRERRFDPEETKQARASVLEAVTSIQAERDVDELLKLKAADVQAYLDSGIA